MTALVFYVGCCVGAAIGALAVAVVADRGDR